MPTAEYTHIVGVECPECKSETMPSWPFPHCWRCGNRNWPDNETSARKAKHDSERADANYDAKVAELEAAIARADEATARANEAADAKSTPVEPVKPEKKPDGK